MSGCDNELTQAPGSFTSPGYPEDYPPDSVCNTLITAPSTETVFLVIQDFMLEFDEEGCTQGFDTLSIYDGDSDEAPLIGVYCYNVIPPSIESTSENIFIVFRSDSSTSARGFEIAYYFRPGKLKY